MPLGIFRKATSEKFTEVKLKCRKMAIFNGVDLNVATEQDRQLSIKWTVLTNFGRY